MKNNNWWQEGMLRTTKGFIGGWKLSQTNVEDIPEIVKKYVATGCNMVQIPVIQIGEGCGTDPGGFYFKSKTEPNNNPDLLKPFLDEFHKYGVRCIVYFNGHSFIPEFYRLHPDWVMYNEEGKPHLKVYGTGASACPNNLEYREWQANVIRDLCEYDIDGVFLDGDIFFAPTCYCDTCKKLFKDIYGKDLPKKSDKMHPDWRLLRQFQIDSLTSYVEHLYKALKNERPQSILYCNAGLRTPNWTTGRQNRRLIEVQDVLLSEGGYLYANINNTPIWRTECENKLCVTQSAGKPVVSGMAMDHKRWNLYQLPMTEPRLMMYSALAAGSHPSSAIASAVVSNVENIINTVKGVHTFVKENEKTLYPTVSLAKTAVVWSNVNADYYAGGSVRRTDFTGNIGLSDIGDLHQEFEGFYDACFRNHVPSNVIDEVSLIDGSLENFDVVMLPNIACMSDKEMDSLREYVKNGGTLISSFETSLFNEFGEKRQDFGLSDLFGISLSEQKVYGPLLWDYAMPAKSSSEISKIYAKQNYIPAPKYCLKTTAVSAEKVFDFAEFMKGCYDGAPGRSKHGFIYVNNYGKGRSIYFSGTIGQALIEWHFFEYNDIIGKLIKDNSPQPIDLIDTPESVSLNIRKNTSTGEILVYLTNLTGTMTRPMRKVCKHYNIKIKTTLELESIRSIFTCNEIKTERCGNEYILTVPELNEFEIIALKTK